MAINASKVKNTSSGPRAPHLEEGGYPGRLVAVIDLGLQPQEYNGESKAPKTELQTIYELSDEFMPGENGEPDESKPRWIWESFALNNLNSDRATSTKRYMALDPKMEFDGDWSQLLGAPVIVGLTAKPGKSGVIYNNVGSTSAMRPKEAAKLPELVNSPILFDMDNPDVEVFLSLPDRIQGVIKEGLEFEGSKLDKALKAHKAGGKKEDENPQKDPAPDVKSGADKTASHSNDEDSDDNDW